MNKNVIAQEDEFTVEENGNYIEVLDGEQNIKLEMTRDIWESLAEQTIESRLIKKLMKKLANSC